MTLKKTNSIDIKDQTESICGENPVLVIRHIINERGQYASMKIDVMSRRLREILTEINHDVVGFRLSGDPVMV